MGGVLWAVYCGRCTVGGVLWAVYCGRVKCERDALHGSNLDHNVCMYPQLPTWNGKKSERHSSPSLKLDSINGANLRVPDG